MDEAESLLHTDASHPFVQSWKDKIQQKLNALNVSQKKEENINMVLKLIQENRRREKLKEQERKEKKEKEFWTKPFPINFPKEKLKPEKCLTGLFESQLTETIEKSEMVQKENESESDEEFLDIEDIFPSSEKRESGINKEVHHQIILPPLKDVETTKKSFIWRPNKLVFKDIEVGKTYKRKIILFNASGISNTCHIEGITNELEGLLKFKLTKSSNNIAPDMHCTLRVYFIPMEEKNLNGEICLISKTGPFRIPVEIQKKISKLNISPKNVDFGQQYIGTTAIKLISVINEGAKRIQFSISRYRGFPTACCSFPQLGSVPQDFSQRSFEVVSSGTEIDTELTKVETEISEIEECEGVDAVEADVSNTSRSDIALANVEDFQLVTSEHDIEILDGFSFRQISHIVEGHSKLEVEVTFNPVIPGSVEAYFVLNFDNLDNDEFLIQISGIGMDPPVSVERENYDMKICIYDHVYQDIIVVKNSSSKAANISFEIGKQMKTFLEVSPPVCVIQPLSSFSACLKFHPRRTLEAIGEPFFDVQTGVFEAAISIRASEQAVASSVIVSAIVTTSDLILSPQEIDFGLTHIQETVKTSIQIINPAFVNQKFGFVDLPTFISIQPQDGFGIILPQETLTLEVLFSPKENQCYKFSLTCKNILNRIFQIKCKGIGIELPICISHNTVKFAPTTHHSSSVATILLEQCGTNADQPIKFRFGIPNDFPGSIEPHYGILENNEPVKIFVTFSPCHEDNIGKQEKTSASNDVESEDKYDFKQSPDHRFQSPDRQVSTLSGSRDSFSLNKKNVNKHDHVISLSEEINSGSTEYWEAVADNEISIAKVQIFSICCFFTSESDKWNFESSNDFLSLDVVCPTAKSSIALFGPSLLNFGIVVVGQKVIKDLMFKNITNKKFQISTSYLNVSGPFLILNSIQTVLPDEVGSLQISYEPKIESKDLEVLDLYYDKSFISITLSGESVSPKFSLHPMIDNVNVGYSLCGDYSECSFSIENKSKINLSILCCFDNQITYYHDFTSIIPALLHSDSSWNLNGSNVFADETSKKLVGFNEDIVIHIKFKSSFERTFKTKCRLFITNNREFPLELAALDAVGTASNDPIYLAHADIPHNKMDIYEFIIQKGFDLKNQEEQMQKRIARIPSQSSFTDKGKRKIEAVVMAMPLESKHCYLHFYSSWTDGGVADVSRSVSVAYILGHSGSFRKTLDFVVEISADTDKMGFTWEPSKGTIEIGSAKEITFKWSPPPYLRMSQVLFTNVCIKCKSDFSKDFFLTLCGGIKYE